VAEFVAGAPYGARVVTLTRDGLVFFNDERIPLESLGAALHQAGRRDAALVLTVQADARVSYGDIVRVMNMATAAVSGRLIWPFALVRGSQHAMKTLSPSARLDDRPGFVPGCAGRAVDSVSGLASAGIPARPLARR